MNRPIYTCDLLCGGERGKKHSHEGINNSIVDIERLQKSLCLRQSGLTIAAAVEIEISNNILSYFFYFYFFLVGKRIVKK